MGHRPEHPRALLHLFSDALLHLVECMGGLSCLAWTGFIQWRAVEVFAQALGSITQALDGSAEQFGTVPGRNDQRDELSGQRYQGAAEPGARWSRLKTRIHWQTLSVQRMGKFRREGRRRRWAVMVKPEKRQ